MLENLFYKKVNIKKVINKKIKIMILQSQKTGKIVKKNQKNSYYFITRVNKDRISAFYINPANLEKNIFTKKLNYKSATEVNFFYRFAEENKILPYKYQDL